MLFLIPTVLAENTAEQVLNPQILHILAETKHFLVENVRTTRRTIAGLKLGIVIDDLTFYELTKDTPEAETKANLLKIKDLNVNAGVISEAGCPGIADPGAVAVGIAHEIGMKVVPLVGPNSIVMALMASGLNGQSFAFTGYLPIDKTLKTKAIKALEQEAKRKNQTQIFMETPYRNNQLFDDLLAICLPDTLLCVAADITGAEEFIQTYSIKNWKQHKPELHKKPCIFLLL